MHPIDFIILIIYLIGMIYIGFYFEKKASTGIDAYFLGNRSLPWWLLGSSGMSGNFDVTGTMINTAFIFAIGAAGFFIEFRGGVTLIMAFLLAFMGKWNRRARVMTIAEWMKFRFGEGRDGHFARIIGAISQLIFAVAMVTYFVIGSGKFFAEFFNIPPIFGISPDMIAAIGIIILTMGYTVSSGLYAVVWTDFIQSIIIFVTIFYIAIMVFTKFDIGNKFNISYPLRPGDYSEQIVKADWAKASKQLPGDSLKVVYTNPANQKIEINTDKNTLGTTLLPQLPENFNVQFTIRRNQFESKTVNRAEWTSMRPRWKLDFPKYADYSIYNLFGIAILFYLLKVFLEGSGGTGGYMIQRYFAAKSDRDAGLLSVFWTFLLSFRWLFIGSIAILGVYYFNNVDTSIQSMDPEKVLPIVIHKMIPTGLKGLMVAGMMAAAMSTFSATINAGATYWIKDIYQTYINPSATEKKLVWYSKLASIIIVIIGILFAFTIRNINEIWGWITMSIGSGLLIPFLARWYWWRLNGWGFSGAVVIGMAAAIVQKIVFPYIPEYVSFLIINTITALSLVIITLLTKPSPDKVLENFYNVTRPFGFWKKYRERLNPHIQAELKKEHRFDIMTLFLAVPWQVCLFMMWMALIMKRFHTSVYLIIGVTIISVLMYFTWFKRLSTEVDINAPEKTK
ncbi:MAG: sodium:solute symporter [Candidatus Neomarinimicrobiota bacterium]